MNEDTRAELEGALATMIDRAVGGTEVVEVIERAIEQGVREELASLGGHMLASVPGQTVQLAAAQLPHPLASLGGYLTQHYGNGDAADEPTAEV